MATPALQHVEIGTTLVRPWSWDPVPPAEMTAAERFQAVSVLEVPIDSIPDLQGMRSVGTLTGRSSPGFTGGEGRDLRPGRRAAEIWKLDRNLGQDGLHKAPPRLCDPTRLLRRTVARWLTQIDACTPEDAALWSSPSSIGATAPPIDGMRWGVVSPRAARDRLSKADLPSPKRWPVLRRSLTVVREDTDGGKP